MRWHQGNSSGRYSVLPPVRADTLRDGLLLYPRRSGRGFTISELICRTSNRCRCTSEPNHRSQQQCEQSQLLFSPPFAHPISCNATLTPGLSTGTMRAFHSKDVRLLTPRRFLGTIIEFEIVRKGSRQRTAGSSLAGKHGLVFSPWMTFGLTPASVRQYPTFLSGTSGLSSLWKW